MPSCTHHTDSVESRPRAFAELPFEVRGPDHIGLIERRVRPPGVKAVVGSPASAGAAMALEDPVDRGHRRYELDRHPLRQQPAHLPGAPPIAPLQAEDLLDHGGWRRVRATVRPVRAIDEPPRSCFPVPLEPLVAGLPAHLVAPAHFGDRPARPMHILHEAQTHIHERPLFPRHGTSWRRHLG